MTGKIDLINNRQGGRRRGRGGQRPGGNPGRPDNRQRGNAPQLHEKYKNMARDAQLAGDRVQAEYYLQFSDHYFRVMTEMRAKQEEQREQREARKQQQRDDQPGPKGDGDDQPKRRRAKPQDDDQGEDKPKRTRANGRAPKKADKGGDETIAMEALPPSIGGDDAGEEKPKRRARKPKAEDGESEGATAS